MLILYLATLLNLFISLIVICIWWQLYLFPFNLYTLCFLILWFLSLLAVARISDAMLDRSGESEHSCLIQDFSRKAFSFIKVLYWWWVCHKELLLGWDKVPTIPTLVRVSMMNRWWILSNAFSVPIDMIMWFLFLLLLMWYITVICIS